MEDHGEAIEKSDALRLLSGLENGSISTADAYAKAQAIDPVFCYIAISYLRACYPASDPAATSVLERVVKLSSTYPAFIGRCKQGEGDPISRWFEGEHAYRDYRGRDRELIDLIAEKING